MSEKKITLTLDGIDEAPKAPDIPAIEEAEVISKETLRYTPEEQQMIDDFAEKIDLNNSNLVLQYGVGAQQKISTFSEKTLETVKSKDLGEVGNLLSNVVVELKSFGEEDTKGFFGLFKKGANKITEMKAKYDSAEENVVKITKALESHQVQLLKDISMLDQMYELNEDYYKELSMYIAAGEKKLQQTRSVELPALYQKAKTEGSSIDAQKANDLAALCNRFEKKLHDLDLTRMVSLQMAPQIRMVQASDAVMVEKIQSTIVNTIPLWKSQMVLALGLHHAEAAVDAQTKVTDLTNSLLKKNADTLKQSTIDVARASERGIIDVETIKHTNDALITALDEVKNIQIEGSQRREKATMELRQLEQDLKARMMETNENAGRK